MKVWITYSLVCAAVFVAAPRAKALRNWVPPGSRAQETVPRFEPAAYLSDSPNHCLTIEGLEFLGFRAFSRG
jgi:hypothetical protein